MSQLIATKLNPPSAPTALVHRARLEASLDASLDEGRRVILVCAPAGSGKSTLVAGWLASRSEATCWVQVESADNDPARFWRYVVGAIGTVQPDVARAVRPVVASATGGPDLVIEHLVNALVDAPSPIVLAIDDYHLIDDPEIHDGVDRLVELSPDHLTIVLASRTDPPVRLGRLRVRGLLAEVRAADLRFDPDEAVPLLGAAGGTLSPSQVDALCDRTEGWAAGLVLAGISLGTALDTDAFVSGFQGDDRLVVDYLTDEFLTGTTDADRDRLLRTSILETMSGPLVDAVCGTTDGAAWLRRTATSNQLVVGLDQTSTWFRYHHLLADLLRLEADARIADELPTLHRRAAEWQLEHGNAHLAVEHLIAGGAGERAADVIWDEATALLNHGLLRTVGDQIDRLGAIGEGHAGCQVVRGWIALLRGRHGEARRCLTRAHALGPLADDVAGLAEALSIMCELGAGNVAAALTVPEASADPIDATHAMSRAVARVYAGRFDEARPYLRLADQLAATGGDAFVSMVTPIHEAMAEIESGDRAAAAERARTAIEVARRWRFHELAQLAAAHSIVGRTTDGADAATEVRRGVELARRAPEPLVLAYALASAGDVLATLGEDAAPAIEARTIIDRCPDPGIVGSYLARVESRHGLAAPARPAPGQVEALTDRELAVLRYLPSALSQREIAAELYVSLNTVKTHCRAIYRKLGVTDRPAAIQAAREAGLL